MLSHLRKCCLKEVATLQNDFQKLVLVWLILCQEKKLVKLYTARTITTIVSKYLRSTKVVTNLMLLFIKEDQLISR